MRQPAEARGRQLLGSAGVDGALAALAGAAHALAFAPQHAWWLQIAALAWLAARVQVAAPRRALWLGWCFGSAWLLAGIWWLFISMHRYGGLPGWLAALAVFALCAALALYLAVAMGAHARWRGGQGLGDVALFAACWCLAEWARATLFTGFPWLAGGYAHTDGPLAGWAPWVGVLGLGAVAAAVAAALAAFVRAVHAHATARAAEGTRLGLRPAPDGASTPAGRASGRSIGVRVWPPALLALALLAAGWLAPRDFTVPTGTLRLALLQGNVPQDEKFAMDRVPGMLEWYGQALVQAAADGRTDLVIAPETAIPLLPAQLPDGWWGDLLQGFAAQQRHALLGIPLGDRDAGYTNSALGLRPGVTDPAGLYRYDKHHLVPFGEFIPPGFRWFVDLMHMPLGDFQRGPLRAPSFEVRGEQVAPTICYEDLFGNELAARFTGPGPVPTVLANLSNIAWFGPTIAVDQHLQISRMRALEFQRPMVRATNTGATAVIDHQGRVTHLLAPHTRGVLQAQANGRTGLTPYARWAGVAGHLPLALLAAAVLALAAWRQGRRTAPGTAP